MLKGKFPSRCIKLDNGWKNFCRLHSFREGDKIIFECDTRNPSSHFRLFVTYFYSSFKLSWIISFIILLG